MTGKTQDALEKTLNGAVRRLVDVDRAEDLSIHDRDILAATNAIVAGQRTIAQHMDEDRADNQRFQNRMFAFSTGILGSVLSAIIVLVVTRL